MQSQLNFEFTKAHAPAFQGIMGDTCDERAATATNYRHWDATLSRR
jgi:hypothetical protein